MRKLLFAAMAGALVATSAAAQQQPVQPPRTECTPGMKPGSDAPKSGQAPLGKELADSKGVICPPDVDPGMKLPPPETGAKMPVIPPPGSPGGDRKVEPK